MCLSRSVNRAITCAAACVALWSAQAQASDDGFERLYLGVGAGMVDDASRGLDLDAAGPSLRLGYEFNQRLSAELGYLALGEVDDDESDSWSASLVVTFPLTAVDLYGRFGAMYNDNQQPSLLGSGVDVDARSTRGFAALGAQVRFRKFDLYGEYSRIDTDSSEDVDIISAGLKFRF